ncbi:MAG: hypothetical protein J6A85_07455 [Clostridia bacterium]|nr:hypothetical protein [Clostridia bacterium]
MKKEDIRIVARVTQKEKERICGIAKRCGLTTTEYLRQRALGYEPKPVPPDALFHFCERLDALVEQPFSAEVNAAALSLLKNISAELITPRKENMRKWQPQAFGPSEDG